MAATGMSLAEVLETLASRSGLLGVSGVSGDIRDLEAAAADGHEAAQLAIDIFVAEIRRQLGGLLVALGGLDSLIFTGGIGENGQHIRAAVCEGMSEFGIELDPAKNGNASGECPLQSESSRASIWVIPTNEELIVARQAKQLLEG
jgi:acetate kinase